MTPRSRLGIGVALASLAGVTWYSSVSRDQRLEVLERELRAMHDELRASSQRVCPAPATGGQASAPALAPGLPPEALAQRVAELLDERTKTRPREDKGAPPAPLPLPPGQRLVLHEAERLVDLATGSSPMQPEEVAALRSALQQLGPAEEAFALRQRLIVANNRGELNLPAPGVLAILF